MIEQVIRYVLDVVFGLFTYALLLRFAMQLLRAPFRNPLGQAVIALTDWIVKPLRRIVPGWKGVQMSELLGGRLKMKARIDNDVNAMALGECTFGSGRTYQHAVFVTLGTGVGGGLLINNQLYRGAHHMADDRQAADRMQYLGRCRPHAGAFPRRQNDRQQLRHARPVIHA